MGSVVLAKALYSNDSEADDELSFKKGDIITVLETDFQGMVGWWLCSLGENQGVAPGNRLQLISFDDRDTNGPESVYDTPIQAHKERYGDVDYDVPKSYPDMDFKDYAIPKSPHNNYPLVDSQRHGFVLPSPRAITAERNSNSSDGLVSNELHAAPSSRYSSERSSDEFRFSGEVSHGSASDEIYDIPSRNSIESDDGQRNLPLPVIPPKARDGVSSGYHSRNTSRQGSLEIYDSPMSSRISNHSEIYDQLPSNNELSDKLPHEDVYDQLPRNNELYDQLPSNELYDQLPGNDVQQLGLMMRAISNDGEDYATIPSPPIDRPQDIYDVPPTFPDSIPAGHEDVYDVPPVDHKVFTSELPRDTTDLLCKRGSHPDGNNNPPALPGNAGGNAFYEEIPAAPEEVYDNFTEGAKASMKHGKKRHDSDDDDYVDYQEIYGIGEEDNKKKSDDSPTTRQSVLERIRMDKVRELRVSHLVAMRNLDKLQQAVDVAVTKLMSFVTDDWRRSEVYALNINGIRDISGKVKVALRLLTEFGLGALKNSQTLRDVETSKKIQESLEPLLESYYSIKTAIQQLDESNWRSAYQVAPDDDLNTIVKIAQCIPCGAYNLGAVIANVAHLLFAEETTHDNAPRTTKTQNNMLGVTSKNLETRRTSQDAISALPVSTRVEITGLPEVRQPSQDAARPSPVAAQVESLKIPVARKVEAEAVKPNIAIQSSSKTPPGVLPKPKRERKRTDGGPNTAVISDGGPNTAVISDGVPNTAMVSKNADAQLLSEQVTELTNNLLNQIDTIKTPPQNLGRKGSKKLSPRTVRKLCSITLKNDDLVNEKIFEDVSAIPPKPSRECSSPTTPNDKRHSLTASISDPGPFRSGEKGSETMQSFVQKMNSEFMVLKEAIKSFGDSVRERQQPKHFVAHSKFIVLSAHKLVYIGDGASRSVGADDQATTSAATNALSKVINIFVDDIKIAARQYPEEAAMNCMIKSATNVTEKAVGLYKALKRQEKS